MDMGTFVRNGGPVMRAEPSSPQSQKLLSAFQYPAFGAMWLAMVMSSLGVWVNEIAMGWVMTSLTSSPIYISLIQACTVAPIFLFGLLAGALGDRMNRRLYLISVECVLILVALMFAFVVLSGRATPVLLLVLTFLTGTALAFSSPVRQAVLANLVPKSHLGSAFTLNAVGFNGARAAGPALGGGLIAAFGAVFAIFTTAVSYLCVVLILFRWKGDPTQSKREKAEGGMREVMSDTAAGWSYLLDQTVVRNALLRHFLFMFGASAFWALLPLEARALSGGDPFLYSVAVAIVGAGSILGGWPVPRVLAKQGPEFTLSLGLILIVAGLFSLGAGVDGVSGYAALACYGVGWIVVSAVIGTTVQVHADTRFRARVMSIFMVEYALAMMLGSVTWGLVTAQTTMQTSYTLAAVSVSGCWLLAIFAPMRERVTEQPAE